MSLVTAMNFLVTEKKANEHLLKYSVFMIHSDKLGTLLLSLLVTYKVVCQTVRQFDQSLGKKKKKPGRSNKGLFLSKTIRYENVSWSKNCTIVLKDVRITRRVQWYLSSRMK